MCLNMKSCFVDFRPFLTRQSWSALLAAILMLCPVLGWGQRSTTLVISQVFGGGGNSGAQYTNDFIELHNVSDAPISLAGYSVQYFSATGTQAGPAQTLSGNIPAGGYFLIQESAGAAGAPLPTPDFTPTSPYSMSATAGRVDLALLGVLIDRVGYGAPTTNVFEGAGPTPALANTTAAIRKGSGCTDTNNNNADFDVLAPAPRNAASSANICPPIIVSLSASTGPVGTTVVITGTNLTGATAVLFGSTSTTAFTVNSSTQITVTVPVGATTGPVPVSVVTPNGTAVGSTFIVVALPVISGMSPGSGPVGTVVTITGTDLDLVTAVTVGGVATGTTVLSSTSLTFVIPVGTPLGSATITGTFGIAIGTFLVTAPLPVELVRFAAGRQAEAVRVEWATATEKNNAYFEVQRSATGKEFSSIARVEGVGNSSRLQSYLILDQRPLPGTSYYRLRQVDLDGTASFSPVVAVAPSKELVLYPNPAHDELYLQYPSGPSRYRVLSLPGQVVLEGSAPTGSATLNLASLPAGLYQLELTSDAGRMVRKFIKN